jgi:ADP-ribose pyrophosphatase
MTADIRTSATRVVYENRWIRVREDQIVRRDGSPGLYSVVEKPDFVVIAAVDAGGIYLVEQFRYPVGARYWELPQGVAASSEGQVDPLEAARAELGEETGLVAGEMIDAGRLFLAHGLSNQAYNVYLGRQLSKGNPSLEPEEQDLICRRFGLAEFEAMMRDGVIRDATTLAAWSLLRLKGLL